MNLEVNRILREREAAKLLGVSHRTMQRWRLTGDGPPFVRIGPRAVGYPLGSLLDWMRRRTLRSTSQDPDDEPEAA